MHRSPPSAIKRMKKDTVRMISETHSKHFSKGMLEAIDMTSHLDHRERPQTVDEFIEIMTSR